MVIQEYGNNFLLKNITRLQVLHKNTLMGVSEVRDSVSTCYTSLNIKHYNS